MGLPTRLCCEVLMGVASSPPHRQTQEAYLESSSGAVGSAWRRDLVLPNTRARGCLSSNGSLAPSLLLLLSLVPPAWHICLFLSSERKQHAALVVQADAANVADSTFVSLRVCAASRRLLQSVDKAF